MKGHLFRCVCCIVSFVGQAGYAELALIVDIPQKPSAPTQDLSFLTLELERFSAASPIGNPVDGCIDKPKMQQQITAQLCKAAHQIDDSWIEYLLATAKTNNIVQAINGADKNGDTPLHHAARSGCKMIVKLLIAAGADKTIKNNNGKTALDCVLARARIREAIDNKMVELLTNS